MDEFSKPIRHSTERLKATVEEKVETVTIKSQRIAIRSIYDSTMRYTGRVSGEAYTWQKIGDVVQVLAEDAPFLLEKRLGSRSCCGGVNQDGNKIFELAKN